MLWFFLLHATVTVQLHGDAFNLNLIVFAKGYGPAPCLHCALICISFDLLAAFNTGLFFAVCLGEALGMYAMSPIGEEGWENRLGDSQDFSACH